MLSGVNSAGILQAPYETLQLCEMPDSGDIQVENFKLYWLLYTMLRANRLFEAAASRNCSGLYRILSTIRRIV